MEGLWIRKPQGDTSIVFVHGILSSSEECWRNENQSYWPNLVNDEQEFKDVGIYVFSYRADVFSGNYSLRDAVDSLKEHLRLDGVLEKSRRIAFVCHSMGGIVARQYLVLEATDLINRNIQIGLFLIASPSLGSSYANLVSGLAKILGNTQVQALRFTTNNAWLNDLDKNFLNLKEHQNLHIKGKELIEDTFFVFKKLFFLRQVVPPFSGARYFGDPYKVPYSDHKTIAKPENGQSIQHRLLCQFITELLSDPQTAPARAGNISNVRTVKNTFDLKPMGEAGKLNAQVDFVIVTALEEERDAVLTKLPGYSKVPPTDEDIRVYFTCELPATFDDGSNTTYRVILVPLLNMGRIEAANATGDAIRRWNPSYVLLVGIAGGVSEMGIELGDLLISDQIVDYELQKITQKGPEVRYSVHRVDPVLVGAAKNDLNNAWQNLLIVHRPSEGAPKRNIGAIATGDKVIAFKPLLEQYREDWPKLIGVEMEAGGVASACFQARRPPPGFFMVRCVSDFADSEKDSVTVSKWRSYACDVAAAYAIGLLQGGPVPSRTTASPPISSLIHRPKINRSSSNEWTDKERELRTLIEEIKVEILDLERHIDTYKNAIEGYNKCCVLIEQADIWWADALKYIDKNQKHFPPGEKLARALRDANRTDIDKCAEIIGKKLGSDFDLQRLDYHSPYSKAAEALRELNKLMTTNEQLDPITRVAASSSITTINMNAEIMAQIWSDVSNYLYRIIGLQIRDMQTSLQNATRLP